MNNLMRRDFLKMVGATITAPVALKAEAVSTKPSPAGKEKITPIIEPETGAKKGKVAGQPPAIYCDWQFTSIECGYKGNDIMCFKDFADCKAKGNEARFGGFPPIRKNDEPKA